MTLKEKVIDAIKLFFKPIPDFYRYLTSDETGFRFDKNGIVLLDKLKEKTKSPDRSSTIKKAIALLEMSCDAKDEGNRIAIIARDRTILTIINLE